MAWYDDIKTGLEYAYVLPALLKNESDDAAGSARDQFIAGGTAGYQNRGGQIDQLSQALMARAQGQGQSITDMQHRQALARALAQQQSMAAGARPGQQAMAARLAAQNMGNISAQAHEQALMARLAEQQQAQSALGQLLLGARGQDIQAGLGGLGTQRPATTWEKALGLAAQVAPAVAGAG